MPVHIALVLGSGLGMILDLTLQGGDSPEPGPLGSFCAGVFVLLNSPAFAVFERLDTTHNGVEWGLLGLNSLLWGIFIGYVREIAWPRFRARREARPGGTGP